MPTHTLSDFDFELPPELIAQHPAAERSASRLLDGRGPDPVDRVFRELPELLLRGDLVVVNDTRVIRARLLGRKASGGTVEALVERVLPDHEVLAHLRASKSPRTGSVVRFAAAFDAEVLGRGGAAGTPEGALYRLRFPDEPHALLERHGKVPLPPYIAHDDSAEDAERYQTVFAARPGAVAAPTAALHVDAELLDRLRQRGIGLATLTLHVGAGTFQPVRTENIAEHRMHREWFEVPPPTVDGAGRLQAGSRETAIFITPGFRFQVVDLLVTNFHLPKSTLMMLVSAFAGHARVMALYRHAIAARYRFFSYGDAMLLQRAIDSPGDATAAVR